MKKYVLIIVSFVLIFHYQAFGQIKDAGMGVRARPLELNRVRLLGGPLKQAQDLDAKYLLELEPDRMLAYYRQRAGLEPKGKPYGGWDGGGRNLTGHIAGHYLSAVSLMWAAAGVKLQMDTDFPEGESATLKFTLESPRQFVLALRRPGWASDGFTIKVNSQPVSEDVIDPLRNVPESGRKVADRRLQKSGSYVELKRTWETGDSVELILPKTLRAEPLPDNPRRVAIMWGPLVLAGDLGPEEQGRREGRAGYSRQRTPVFITAEQPVEEWLKLADDKPGYFRTDGVGRERDVDFVPFYQLHRRTYAVYWDLFTEPEWKEKEAEYAAEEERLRKLESATVAYAQPGEMQPERDFNYQSPGDAWVVRMMGRPGRWGRSWFSFDLPVESDQLMALVVTYCSDHDSRGRAIFDILVDGKHVASQKVTRSSPARFYDIEYAIDSNLIEGKEKVTVRFQATEGNVVAAIFGIRMIRADAER